MPPVNSDFSDSQSWYHALLMMTMNTSHSQSIPENEKDSLFPGHVKFTDFNFIVQTPHIFQSCFSWTI